MKIVQDCAIWSIKFDEKNVFIINWGFALKFGGKKKWKWNLEKLEEIRF